MFVPVVPPIRTSPRAQELSGRLTATIEEFRQTHPDLKSWEIEAALRRAARDVDGLRRVKFAVLLGLVALAGVAGLFLTRSGAAPRAETQVQPAWLVGVLVGILAIAAALVVLRRR